MNRLELRDLLAEDWIPIYERRLTALHNELARIRGDLVILETIVGFPFDLFGANSTFWKRLPAILLSSIVQGLWRIVVDPHRFALTLRKLRTEALKRTRDDRAREILLTRLREIDFDDRFKAVEGRIDELRNRLYGHLDVRDIDSDRRHPPVDVKTLLDAAEAVHDLLHVVGFDKATSRSFVTYPMDYDPALQRPAWREQRIDIEVILDRLAETSAQIRLPEEQPDALPYFLRKFSAEERAAYNAYRRKFGMTPVDIDVD